MAPKADDDADIAKVPGARILVSRNKETCSFVGLYAFVSSKGVFIRAYRTWLRATGHALQQFNDTRVTHMASEFIGLFDDLDEMGRIPSDAEIARFVDHSYDLPKLPKT